MNLMVELVPARTAFNMQNIPTLRLADTSTSRGHNLVADLKPLDDRLFLLGKGGKFRQSISRFDCTFKFCQTKRLFPFGQSTIKT